MIQKPRGTMDILPDEVVYWQYIEKKARDVAARYGFGEIRLPTFEVTELFQRGVGGTTDVVQKEMYTFQDRDGKSISLRPEGTAGTVRALIENGKCSDVLPLKLYYILNCFRHEKPQAGRYREFYQFGVEMFGAGAAAADASVISLANTLLTELGVKNIHLHINSIGCPVCRPQFQKKLREYLELHRGELCQTCQGRLDTNPLRVLDCKNPECRAIAEKAPKTIEHLCPECASHFSALQEYLQAEGIRFEVDSGIVRGLDYYTRTVFEFIAPVVGAQSTVCGGGRYDGLMQELGGPALPGIGFGMGINRLILAMQGCGIHLEPDDQPLLYIASMGHAASVRASAITETLRRTGVHAECDLAERSLKAQMKYANKLGARYTLILGDQELETGTAQLKNMETGEQLAVRFDADGELFAALGVSRS